LWGLLLASQREDQRHEVHLRVLRLVHANPELSTRKIAEDVGISNGSAFYVLAALVEKGFLKLDNFKNSSNKGRYAYILTPKGLREKTLLTARFIERKREEYKNLRAEIEALEREAGLAFDDGHLSDPRR
jgi:EPS-associated MarR family transcriptional regulator